jgi:class 3 adenylate cyclase
MPIVRVERRLAAIMAADIVAYSRLIERDEAGTLTAIRALHSEVFDPLITDHKGRIVKLMGDGAIVAFDSIVDAVVCAAGIQKAAAARNDRLPEPERLVFRMGINLGDVALVDGDVYGDGVNVAARLEQLCEPGGVIVSGTAFDHLQGKLDWPLDFAGEQQVKHISRPVRMYRLRLDGKRVKGGKFVIQDAERTIPASCLVSTSMQSSHTVYAAYGAQSRQFEKIILIVDGATVWEL